MFSVSNKWSLDPTKDSLDANCGPGNPTGPIVFLLLFPCRISASTLNLIELSFLNTLSPELA